MLALLIKVPDFFRVGVLGDGQVDPAGLKKKTQEVKQELQEVAWQLATLPKCQEPCCRAKEPSWDGAASCPAAILPTPERPTLPSLRLCPVPTALHNEFQVVHYSNGVFSKFVSLHPRPAHSRAACARVCQPSACRL